MKSTTKVTVQVEDYKGNMTDVTGFKQLKRNNHGNVKGFVGREVVKYFTCDFDAFMWFFNEDSAKVAEACNARGLI